MGYSLLAIFAPKINNFLSLVAVVTIPPNVSPWKSLKFFSDSSLPSCTKSSYSSLLDSFLKTAEKWNDPRWPSLFQNAHITLSFCRDQRKQVWSFFGLSFHHYYCWQPVWWWTTIESLVSVRSCYWWINDYIFTLSFNEGPPGSMIFFYVCVCVCTFFIHLSLITRCCCFSFSTILFLLELVQSGDSCCDSASSKIVKNGILF